MLLIGAALLLASCSTENSNDNSHDNSDDNSIHSQVPLTPPGIEQLTRAINIETLAVDFQLILNGESSPVDVDQLTDQSGQTTWMASFLVPVDVPFSVDIVWSAIGSDNIRLNYAQYIRDFEPLSSDFSVIVQPQEYDKSADTFDHNGDGVSNYHELTGTGAVSPVLELIAVKSFRFSWEDVNDATFYRVLENPDGVSGFSSISPDIPSATEAFVHTVPLFERVNAQYIVQACNETECTDSETVFVSGSLASAVGYFKASNSESMDFFGREVSLSEDGTTLAVRSGGEDSSATGINGDQSSNEAADAAAIYVFSRSNGLWSQQAYIKASNTDAGDDLGFSLSLSADGNTLAAGASGEDSASSGINGNQSSNAAPDSGAVYIFTRNGASWSQQAYIKASNTDENDAFGDDVSISSDGNTLAIGALRESSAAGSVNGNQSDNTAANAGAVYIFGRTGSTWSQQAYIKSSNSDARDAFGDAISLSGDGNFLAVGADGEASNNDNDQFDNTATGSGAVYVFGRDAGGWSQRAYLKASNIDSFDLFGDTVALDADGSTLAVGARKEGGAATGVNGDQSSNSQKEAGAVYVFSRSGDSWSQQAYIKSSNTESGDLFGGTISLSSDGETLAIGAGGEDGGDSGIGGSDSDNSREVSGAVYIFNSDGSSWIQGAYVKSSNTDTQDGFARHSISLSHDGETLAVGAINEDGGGTGVGGNQDDNSSENSGAVYLY